MSEFFRQPLKPCAQRCSLEMSFILFYFHTGFLGMVKWVFPTVLVFLQQGFWGNRPIPIVCQIIEKSAQMWSLKKFFSNMILASPKMTLGKTETVHRVCEGFLNNLLPLIKNVLYYSILLFNFYWAFYREFLLLCLSKHFMKVAFKGTMKIITSIFFHEMCAAQGWSVIMWELWILFFRIFYSLFVIVVLPYVK